MSIFQKQTPKSDPVQNFLDSEAMHRADLAQMRKEHAEELRRRDEDHHAERDQLLDKISELTDKLMSRDITELHAAKSLNSTEPDEPIEEDDDSIDLEAVPDEVTPEQLENLV